MLDSINLGPNGVMPYVNVLTGLWILSSATLAFAAVRLWCIGLQRKYPFFFAYLTLLFVSDGIGLGLGLGSQAYCTFFWSSQPFQLVFRVLVVYELFAQVYEDYPGLRSLARRVLWKSVGVGLGTAAAAMPLVLAPTWGCAQFQCYLFAFLELKRFFDTGLIIFTPYFVWKLSHYKLVLDRNTKVHTACFNAMVGASLVTGIVTFAFRDPQITAFANVGLFLTNIACFYGWAFGMRPADHLAGPFRLPSIDRDIERLTEQVRQFTKVCRLVYTKVR